MNIESYEEEKLKFLSICDEWYKVLEPEKTLESCTQRTAEEMDHEQTICEYEYGRPGRISGHQRMFNAEEGRRKQSKVEEQQGELEENEGMVQRCG